MITLDYLNQLKHVGNNYMNGDGEGALVDMLEMLIPALPPMVGVVVSEFLRNYQQEPNPIITAEDISDERPDYRTSPAAP